MLPQLTLPAQQWTAPIPEKQGVRPLRVLYYLFFPGSGIGRYTHELMRHFEEADDIDAELVCLPSYHWLNEARYRTWSGLREIGHTRPLRRKMRFLTAQFANPMRLARRAAEQGADVVHLCNINYLTFPMWERALRRSGARIVATAHDVRRSKPMISHRYEDRQLKRFYERADALFVHSEAQADDLMEFAGVHRSHVHVVPHGPYDYGRPTASRDEIRSRWGWPREKQVALFFGNIRDDKNLDVLLQALRDHAEAVHLVVAGRGSGGPHRDVASYKRMVERLGLTQHVTFRDEYIPDTEIPDLFEASDWAALPYSRRFTSQSGVLNVAAWYRRPVLMSSSPTFEETLAQANVGLLVEPDDVAALSAGIGGMMDAVQSGREFEFDKYLNVFGWNSNVRIASDVYNSICGR